jgi:hypothetical protein
MLSFSLLRLLNDAYRSNLLLMFTSRNTVTNETVAIQMLSEAEMHDAQKAVESTAQTARYHHWQALGIRICDGKRVA